MADKESGLGITVKKEDDMPEWYQQVCLKSELAEYSTVKGCMIIKPNGYAIWENIQKTFDAMIKKHGVRNAYFPLLIPEKFFKMEKEHAEGFNPEVAWLDKAVTGGERLAIRPTSETIIYDSYSRWVRSYRDLPLKINQWCNVVRWETEATKLFLRSREFLWQEGHCVYETEDECEKDTIYYLNLYKKFIEEFLAIPIMEGKKTDKEKFSGAYKTYSIEAIMPDGKSIQAGTSHNLGQNFAKAFNIKFLDQNEKEKFAWQNSWGISTRLIGALVMTHSDDKGLVLPPKIAPNRVAIIPIAFEKNKKVLEKAQDIFRELSKHDPILDDRENLTAGFKFHDLELKGIPLRIEIGPKDLEKKEVVLVRRDTGTKKSIKISEIKTQVDKELETIQKDLFEKAKKRTFEKLVQSENLNEVIKFIKERKIILIPLKNSKDVEDTLKEKTGGAKTLNIPFSQPQIKNKKCIISGEPADYWVYVGKSY